MYDFYVHIFTIVIIDHHRSLQHLPSIIYEEWERANSEEFDKLTPHPVVLFMPEISQSEMGKIDRLIDG